MNIPSPVGPNVILVNEIKALRKDVKSASIAVISALTLAFPDAKLPIDEKIARETLARYLTP